VQKRTAVQETVARDLFERGRAEATPCSAHDVPPMYERLFLLALFLIRSRFDEALMHESLRLQSPLFDLVEMGEARHHSVDADRQHE
jgi:hypothetical protein